MTPEERLNAAIALAQHRGFVFPSGDIYGGTRSAWDYGPYGVSLKENIKKEWWKTFVQRRGDMVGLDSAVILPTAVWEASGHVQVFSDPLTESLTTHKRYRADHLFEAYEEKHGHPPENGLADIPDPEHPDRIGQWTEIRMFSGLVKTYLGVVDDESGKHYLRPETAQGIFTNFKNIQQSMRRKPPFGIGQIGKSFRNEITPGNFIFRTREFEQMEIEYFVHPSEDESAHEEWMRASWDWFVDLGMNPENIRWFEHPAEKLAHYSKRTVDIEYRFGFTGGEWGELMGVANRTDYDLATHAEKSGKDLSYFDTAAEERYIPYVIEPSFGLSRSVMAFLVDAYDVEETTTADGKKDTRTVLRLDHRLAPFKVAVLPLSRNEALTPTAREVADLLRYHWDVDYDDAQAIGRRYRRQDEVGTPYCVTVDFDSIEDRAVTVRDRDSMQQVRIPIAGLVDHFSAAFTS
ncbi:glycyl-tRNA synthetase [Microbacterium resistens]|uniref:Glycine--tRNA ligase n=1 Tax=Microbacterium resistens TaxID=156977 RepID=A0ABU1SC92_9MICO|nr:glycine--tRNA ligase [Microbacterium resistens]MDR6867227.1 glycyl-tRNA synthetase [Microbacterium resistens]